MNSTEDNLKKSIKNLEFLRDNFGDLDAIREKFGNIIDLCGVCALADFNYIKHVDKIDIEGIIKKWSLIRDYDPTFPVGGPDEYNKDGKYVWTNPRRLAFIEYMIKELNEQLSIVLFRDLGEKITKEHGSSFSVQVCQPPMNEPQLIKPGPYVGILPFFRHINEKLKGFRNERK